MDLAHLETNVYVHSPIIEYSIGGGYYTSYALQLLTNNPCFSRSNSHVRRRYSEFVCLRELLISHHPTIIPPTLPPKSYFHRFNDDIIEQRIKGLQTFLKQVLATPVYLSDKSLHLFLQSNSSMPEINEECIGDIPAPPVVDSETLERSTRKSICNQGAHDVLKSLNQLVLEDCEMRMQSQRTMNKTSEFCIPSDVQPFTSNFQGRANKPILIPKRNGSLDSSTASSPSSSPCNSDGSYSSSCSGRSKNRHVSFDERVKIAVVTNYGITVLRS